MTDPVLIHVDAVPPRPWRNGGGSTRELLTRPAGARDWRLRISVAEVGRDGPFSMFPGVQRWFAVLSGAGVRLSIGGVEQLLEAEREPLHFDGEAAVDCRLVDGATRDLNLMHASGTALMRSAQSAAPWSCDSAQRGMFTRVSGRWQAQHGESLEVPAGCLLWMDEADAGAWTFIAPASTARPTPPPALWLAWDP